MKMKRSILAFVAIFSFATMTFAQAKPAPKQEKAKTETTKKAATDTTHHKTTASKKAAPAKPATKKS